MEQIIFHFKNFFISFCYIYRKKFGSVFINQRILNKKKKHRKIFLVLEVQIRKAKWINKKNSKKFRCPNICTKRTSVSKENIYLEEKIIFFNGIRITIGLALLENKICSTQIDSRLARKRNRNRLGKFWKRLRYTI